MANWTLRPKRTTASPATSSAPIEPETEADPAALLFQLLAAVGNILGTGAYARVEADQHPPRLFVVQVGRTAKGRKGTSWGRVRSSARNGRPRVGQHRVASGLSSGEGVIYEVRDPIERQETDKKTGETKTVVVDHGVADKRLLLFEGEFAKALRSMERQGNTLSAVLRDAWDHGNLRTLVKNNPNRATGAHVSLVGHITDDELRRYLDRTEMANGLANRLIFVCVQRSKLLPRGGRPIDWTGIEQRLRAILAGAPLGEIGRTEAAWGIWEAVYPKLSADRPGLLGAILGRAEAQVLRLALIYALLDRLGVHRRAAPARRAGVLGLRRGQRPVRLRRCVGRPDRGRDPAGAARAAGGHDPHGADAPLRPEPEQRTDRPRSAVLAKGNFVESETERTSGRPPNAGGPRDEFLDLAKKALFVRRAAPADAERQADGLRSYPSFGSSRDAPSREGDDNRPAEGLSVPPPLSSFRSYNGEGDTQVQGAKAEPPGSATRPLCGSGLAGAGVPDELNENYEPSPNSGLPSPSRRQPGYEESTRGRAGVAETAAHGPLPHPSGWRGWPGEAAPAPALPCLAAAPLGRCRHCRFHAPVAPDGVCGACRWRKTPGARDDARQAGCRRGPDPRALVEGWAGDPGLSGSAFGEFSLVLANQLGGAL